MKSMFKYYLNMCSIFRHSAVPRRQDDDAIRRCTRPETRYVTCSVRTSSSLSQTLWPRTPDLNPV